MLEVFGSWDSPSDAVTCECCIGLQTKWAFWRPKLEINSSRVSSFLFCLTHHIKINSEFMQVENEGHFQSKSCSYVAWCGLDNCGFWFSEFRIAWQFNTHPCYTATSREVVIVGPDSRRDDAEVVEGMAGKLKENSRKAKERSKQSFLYRRKIGKRVWKLKDSDRHGDGEKWKQALLQLFLCLFKLFKLFFQTEWYPLSLDLVSFASQFLASREWWLLQILVGEICVC